MVTLEITLNLAIKIMNLPIRLRKMRGQNLDLNIIITIRLIITTCKSTVDKRDFRYPASPFQPVS
jgi:hypothetical protein